jgi:hypothetical protein
MTYLALDRALTIGILADTKPFMIGMPVVIVCGLYGWYAGGAIGTLNSMDMPQWTKLVKTLTTGPNGMPEGPLLYFTHWS